MRKLLTVQMVMILLTLHKAFDIIHIIIYKVYPEVER